MSSNILAAQQTVTSFTITLVSLANGAGRQSSMVDNSSTKCRRAIVYIIIKSGGTGPNAGTFCNVYLLRGDNPASSAYRTDGAGASDAAITIANALPLGAIQVSNTANALFYGEFDTGDVTTDLGPEWGIAIVNNSGQALNASGHVAEYNYIIDQSQ